MRLNLYFYEDLIEIVKRSAAILRIPITPEGAAVIAARSRGTPRIGNRLLRRVRDYAVVKGDGDHHQRDRRRRSFPSSDRRSGAR